MTAVGYWRSAGRAIGTVVRATPAPAAGYLLLTVVAGALPVATAWLTKLLLDQLLRGGHADAGRALAYAAGLVGATLLGVLVPQLAKYATGAIQRAVAIRTQDDLYAAVNGLVGLRPFEDPGFMDRLSTAKQAASGPGEVLDNALQIGRGAITATGLVASLIALSPPMALLVALAAVPALVAELRLSRRRVDLMRELSPTQRREFFYQSLFTNISAAKELRLFGLDRFLRGRVRDERRAADRARRRLDRRDVLTQACLGLLSAATAGVGLLWAVYAATRGRLGGGDIALFIAAVGGVQGTLATLVASVATGNRAVVAFQQYLAVLHTVDDLPVGNAPVPPLRYGIELRDVWFRYGPGQPYVLRGVNLFIPAGRSVALVGANGAGKSTLVKLLCRFYDPTAGSIRWDGVDLRELDPVQLRRRIGVLFQDYMAYDLTARENIGLGDLTALDDPVAIAAAAERAGIDGTLRRLPHGYDTALTRIFAPGGRADPGSGVILSGGQWQRLALARTLLRVPVDFLILDEPNAGLDPESEYQVHQRLRAHRAGRASLLISHRLSAVRDADVIVVLDGGQVSECGPHAELMATGGRYAALFNRQAAGYLPGGEGPPAIATTKGSLV